MRWLLSGDHMDLQALIKSSGPFAHLFIGSPSDAYAATCALERNGKSCIARVVRGKRAKALSGMHDELAAALQFPPHYGENFDAARDCLHDLSWLRPGPILLCILDASELLRAAPAKQFVQFANVMSDALAFWNEPTGKHKVVPFHLLIQTEPIGDVESRWRAAGMPLERVE